jgi:hypothetical protein
MRPTADALQTLARCHRHATVDCVAAHVELMLRIALMRSDRMRDGLTWFGHGRR